MKSSNKRIAVAGTLSLVSATLMAFLGAACSVTSSEKEVGPEAPGELLQAQVKFTPTGCSGGEVPGSYIEACLLAGGTSVSCDGGVAWCCRPCHAGEAGGCDEYCNQDPDGIRTAPTGLDGGKGADTVTENPSPQATPNADPGLDALPAVASHQPISSTTCDACADDEWGSYVRVCCTTFNDGRPSFCVQEGCSRPSDDTLPLDPGSPDGHPKNVAADPGPAVVSDKVGPNSVPSESAARKRGLFGGGGRLVLGNTPYGDCLTDCSARKESCENRNLSIIADRFELAEPCDLDYSFCKADCQRAFPQ